jgi:hypothetical protein
MEGIKKSKSTKVHELATKNELWPLYVLIREAASPKYCRVQLGHWQVGLGPPSSAIQSHSDPHCREEPRR